MKNTLFASAAEEAVAGLGRSKGAGAAAAAVGALPLPRPRTRAKLCMVLLALLGGLELGAGEDAAALLPEPPPAPIPFPLNICAMDAGGLLSCDEALPRKEFVLEEERGKGTIGVHNRRENPIQLTLTSRGLLGAVQCNSIRSDCRSEQSCTEYGFTVDL
jgi:hypothetical protein